MMILPLQLKINNSYNEINVFKKDNKMMRIYNNDKEFFTKCIKIWDRIIELIGINDHIHFLKLDNDDGLFIMADIHNNTSFVIEDNYRYGHNKVVIGLHSVINDCIKTSLVQHNINNHCMYTLIIIKIFLLFFFIVYKNEWKEHKF